MATELFDSTGRRGSLVSERDGMIGTVRKLHKVSEKPASVLKILLVEFVNETLYSNI